MSLSREEVRLIIKHEWLSGNKGPSICDKINNAWGEGTVTRSTVFRWITKFKQGDNNLKDRPNTGRPRKIDREGLLKRFEENPEVSTSTLAVEFGCSHARVSPILNEAGYEWNNKVQKWFKTGIPKKKEKNLKKPSNSNSLKSLNSLPKPSTSQNLVVDGVMASIQAIADAEIIRHELLNEYQVNEDEDLEVTKESEVPPAPEGVLQQNSEAADIILADILGGPHGNPGSSNKSNLTNNISSLNLVQNW